MYLCIAYGVVITEIYSYSKELYLLNIVALYPSLFWLTPKEKRTHRQVLCIMVHLHIYICNTLPLDNLKIHLHIALLYITTLQTDIVESNKRLETFTQHVLHMKVIIDKFIWKVSDNANAIRFFSFILGRISANMERTLSTYQQLLKFRSSDGKTRSSVFRFAFIYYNSTR